VTLDPRLSHLFPGRPQHGPVEGVGRVVRGGVLDDTVRMELARQLGRYLAERAALGYRCLVVGLSGGVDSAVCAQLVRDASPGAACGVIVDLGDADEEVRIAAKLADAVDIPCTVLDGRAVYLAHRDVMPERHLISRVHARSRVITSLLFQYAESCEGLVVDTTDRSEEILRLYEEGGRGHVAPVIDLYKSELYAMVEAMGLPTTATSGCPDLDNMEAFGLPWSQLDAVLDRLAAGASVANLTETLGLDEIWLAKVAQRVRMQPLRTEPVRLTVGD
jgi:NAD+ synthase